jgi:hypothetical protein
MRTSPRWLRRKRRREETALVFHTHALENSWVSVSIIFLIFFWQCRDSRVIFPFELKVCRILFLKTVNLFLPYCFEKELLNCLLRNFGVFLS